MIDIQRAATETMQGKKEKSNLFAFSSISAENLIFNFPK